MKEKFDEYKNNHILVEDIKSLYIINEIFAFLKEKQKLSMVMYNKHLQKLFGLDIEKWKKISRKYKIGERNGIGKIYELNTNILIFEGEYLNGEKNGKGKEYYPYGELNFEGEYSNGERNGKGKEYCPDGELLFEGEYSNGKRHGKGKEYFGAGKLKFEGEYVNGIIHGKGKEYIYNKLVFEGEYINGKKWNGKGLEFEIKNGKGNLKEYFNNGLLSFEGEYLNGEKHGKGKEYNPFCFYQ